MVPQIKGMTKLDLEFYNYYKKMLNFVNHKHCKTHKFSSAAILTSYFPSGLSGCLEVSFSGGGKLQDQFSIIVFDLVLFV